MEVVCHSCLRHIDPAAADEEHAPRSASRGQWAQSEPELNEARAERYEGTQTK